MGPRYSFDLKKSEEFIKAEEIIVVLEKIPSIKPKCYTITEDNLNLICQEVVKRQLFKGKY